MASDVVPDADSIARCMASAYPAPVLEPRRRTRETLSAAEARRVALQAQGFGKARPAEPDARNARAIRQRVLAHTRLIQIDSVNVLERAHYLPAFSRIGAYDNGRLDRLSHNSPRRLFEY